MPGGGFGQLPRIPQTVKAEHCHHIGIVGIVALRENAVIFCRKEYIIEKTLSVMVSLPGKGMQQDVGGGLLDVLPVGGIPQRRQRRGGTGRPELRPHGLGDVVHKGKQTGGVPGRGLYPDGLQREAVQKHIAAYGQAAAAHREQAQAAAVVKGAAADHLQTVRQGDLFQKIAAHRVQRVRIGSRGVKVEVIPTAGAVHCLPECPGQPRRAVRLHRVAAGLVCRRQAAGLFREAVAAQLGDGKTAALRRRQDGRQHHAGCSAVHPHQPGRVCRKGQDVQCKDVLRICHVLTSFSCNSFKVQYTANRG